MADVIIKDMEMRYACSGETDCFALDEHGDYPMCRITGETRGYTFPIRERCMDNCPLRPVLEEWNSVEEILPPNNTPIQLLINRKFYVVARLRKSEWILSWNFEPLNLDSDDVLHWMPLPEPPGGDAT